jgi:hypothetical protein
MGLPPIPGLGGASPSPGPQGGPNLGTIMAALQNKTANPGKELSEQTAELQGADPTMIARQSQSIYDVMGVLFTKTFQHLPNVAARVSDAMKAWQKVLKEIQQASNVSEVVGKADETTGPQPIAFGPAMVGNNAQPDRTSIAA